MKGIETNELIRYLVLDDKRQAAIADRAIRTAVTEGHSLLIGAVVLAETVWVLEDVYGFDKSDIVSTLDKIVSTAEFSIENRDVVQRSLEDFRNGKADFADCLIGRTGQLLGCEHTLSFDRDLTGLDTFQVL
jgi:predicted nucleic-acid-binding protein